MATGKQFETWQKNAQQRSETIEKHGVQQWRCHNNELQLKYRQLVTRDAFLTREEKYQKDKPAGEMTNLKEEL